METDIQVSTPDAGGSPPPGGDAGDVDLGKLLDGSPDDYSRARDQHIAKHGSGSWEKFISGDAGSKPNGKAPAEPAPADKSTGKETEIGEPEDLEPGEIRINAEGKPVDAKTGRFVPHAAFMRVKGEAKEERGRRETLSTEVVQLKERLALLTDLLPASEAERKQPETKPIDPKEDLIGAVEMLLKKVQESEAKPAKEVAELKGRIEAQELRDYTMRDAGTFQKQTPDFQDAMRHAVAIQEAAQIALGLSPEDAKAAVQSQLKGLIADAKASGKSWAERVYNYAKAVGYKQAAQGDGKSDAEKAAEAEIDRINKGRDASASLRGAGGGGVGDPLTRERLVDMPFEEYHQQRKAYVAKHGQAAWDKLMNE